MAVYLPCCKLLLTCLVVLLTGSYVGTTTFARHACRAASIQLFDIFEVHCVNTAWSLYKKNILNIVWDMNGSVPNATFVNGNKDKFFLDKSKNIWILDIQDFDEAIYSIRCPVGNTTKKYEVKLNVLVEPETRCKPKIIRGVDTLTTYLEPDGCGKPAASAYWLEQPGISVDDNVIKLQPGQEAGTVYACINSPALRCAKNSKLSDYCTVFKDESGIQPTLSGIFGITGADLIITTITTLLNGCFILMAIVFHRRQMRMLKKNVQWKHLSVLQKLNQLKECNFCKTDRIVSYIGGTQPLDADLTLERIDERHQKSTDYVTSFAEQEEGLQLIDDLEKANSTPPHVYEGSILQLEEKDTANYTPQQIFDKEHDIEKATTENPCRSFERNTGTA